ncbi:cell division protein ZapA [uncultured Ramlibacter sp.]|uniref:cell division protein ZapA n=1 Tax=uncultured Ramlibacter sp. TaxID=260755 RepID=UPI0026041B52|nr:cell division protein ZapA [uncultured Ramlibacter sp.]
MKQLEVQIMGQSYLLACPEGGDGRLLDAVEKVDTAMCRIRDAGKVKARDRIAVLAALNLAFDVSDRAAPVFTSSLAAPQAPASASATVLADGETDPRLGQLLQRLDRALGDDGRLL